LHNEELRKSYISTKIIRFIESRKKTSEACSMHGRDKRLIRNVIGKPGGKRQLRRCRRMWKNNVKMDFRELAWENVDWIRLDQDATD
jgi:hypothetical protein